MTWTSPEPERSRWARLFASTGAPPAWRSLVTVLVGVALAAGVSVVVHGPTQPAAVAVAAVAGGLVAAAGANAPARLAIPFAVGGAGVVVVFEVVAVAVSGHPWWAALAMGLVAVFTSVGAGASPVGGAFGLLATLAYVLTVLLVSLVPAAQSSGSRFLVSTGALVGAAAGLVVTAAGAALRARRSGPSPAAPVTFRGPWRVMWTSIRSFDGHVHDGLRRGVPLALFVGVYELTGSHDVLWAFIAALVVLLPTAKSPFDLAVSRVVATVVGVAAVLALSALLPIWVLVAGSVLLLLVGVAYKAGYPLLADAAMAMGAIVLVGAPAGAITDYAALRLADTVAGAGIALGFTYLLWSTDRPAGDAGAGAAPEPGRTGNDP